MRNLLRFASFYTLLAIFGMPAAAQDADWSKIIDAAKKEGSVVISTAATAGDVHGAVARSFEKTYGISVKIMELRASEVMERIRTEQASGRYLTDVFQTGLSSAILMQREGLFQPHGGYPNLKNIDPQFKIEGYSVPNYVLAYGMLINTNLVKPKDEPRSWKDILDPKWQGKILSDDPRAVGGGNVMFSAFQEKLGLDYLKRISAQKLVFSRDVGNMERRTAMGEFPLRIPQHFPNIVHLQGLPVKLVTAEEGAPYVRFDLVALKNPPHPNAARLLMNHYIGPEAQLIYANAGLIPTISGVAEKADASMRPLLKAKLLATTHPETQKTTLDLAKQIFQ